MPRRPASTSASVNGVAVVLTRLHFRAPRNDYSIFQRGATNLVDAAIKESAASAGMDAAHWKAIADIESGLNPASNKDKKKTQYKGLYQLGSKASDPEWGTHGMGNIYNPMDNALAAGRLFQYNAERFKRIYGHDPTPGEAYVLHNQGLGFFTRGTMTNIAGNTPAGQGFTPAAQATRDTYLADWTRYLERKAGKVPMTLLLGKINFVAMFPVPAGATHAVPGVKAVPSGLELFRLLLRSYANCTALIRRAMHSPARSR